MKDELVQLAIVYKDKSIRVAKSGEKTDLKDAVAVYVCGYKCDVFKTIKTQEVTVLNMRLHEVNHYYCDF